MPYTLQCATGPWEMSRPVNPALFVVRRSFTHSDNTDIAYKFTVAYLEIGALVLYMPSDRDDIADSGWWRVRILSKGKWFCGQAERYCAAEWVHPGILAAVTGTIHVKGDGQYSAWPATSDRLSCHGMGTKPSPEDKQHSGFCAACIRRMAGNLSFMVHLEQAVRLLENTKTLMCVCKAGKHRSLSLAHVLVSLTLCSQGLGFHDRFKQCSMGCKNCSKVDCAQMLILASQRNIIFLPSPEYNTIV